MAADKALLQRILDELRRCPLIASVQASEDSPLEDPHTLLKLARSSVQEGVRVLRLQGREAIEMIRGELRLPVIGLVKRWYEGSDIYITPAIKEVDELIASGCEVIGIDGTSRPRPGGERLDELIAMAHGAGRFVLADCDTVESVRYSLGAGADMISTTLAGYTAARNRTDGPDMEMLRHALGETSAPVLAEGRYSQAWQMQAALRMGAAGVVVGAALNDAVAQTKRFVTPMRRVDEEVGAFDIGGTWIRFALFSPAWKMLHAERATLPRTRAERLHWMSKLARNHGLRRVGVGTGGTVDPRTNTVWESKPIIPDHEGTDFSSIAEHVTALNDGLATAWGHACLPEFAGRRVATLALGTGVGCGFVSDGRVWMGPRGEYPRLNDLSAPGGCTFEGLLGGAALAEKPTPEQQAMANEALRSAVDAIWGLYFPDEIVLCGGVGLAPWLVTSGLGVTRSPFGEDAGLYGAAALALFARL